MKKTFLDGETDYKAWYSVNSHLNKFKNRMDFSKSTLQPQSVRLLLENAFNVDFRVWTAEICQVYLDAAVPLFLHIHIARPPPEFKMTQEKSQSSASPEQSM